VEDEKYSDRKTKYRTLIRPIGELSIHGIFFQVAVFFFETDEEQTKNGREQTKYRAQIPRKYNAWNGSETRGALCTQSTD
jgi:hypothetical protein